MLEPGRGAPFAEVHGCWNSTLRPPAGGLVLTCPPGCDTTESKADVGVPVTSAFSSPILGPAVPAKFGGRVGEVGVCPTSLAAMMVGKAINNRLKRVSDFIVN